LSDAALDDLLAYLARYRVNEPPRRPVPAGDRD
jgi:hypothetical protein